MAPQELEKSASQYATSAIKYDSQGARGMAITSYQKATESLLKLTRLYPDSKLNKIYTVRMKSYQDRIKILQSTSITNAEPVVDPTASPDEQRANQVKNKYRINAFDSLEELLNSCDAVSIATPTITHFNVAKKAMEMSNPFFAVSGDFAAAHLW